MTVQFGIIPGPETALPLTLPLALVLDLETAPQMARAAGLELPDPTERECSSALVFPDYLQRKWFFLRRGLARALIARYAGCSPTDVTIIRAANGSLQVYPETSCLHLSLSYRGSLIALGLARAPIGVDVELQDPEIEIPYQTLHPKERTKLEALPQTARPEAFFKLWTGKEACVKAVSHGFSISPDSFYLELPDAANNAQVQLQNRVIHLTSRAQSLYPFGRIHVAMAICEPLKD